MKIMYHHLIQEEKGFSLIEATIAVALFSFLITASLSVLKSSEEVRLRSEQDSRMNDQAQQVYQLITSPSCEAILNKARQQADLSGWKMIYDSSDSTVSHSVTTSLINELNDNHYIQIESIEMGTKHFRVRGDWVMKVITVVFERQNGPFKGKPSKRQFFVNMSLDPISIPPGVTPAESHVYNRPISECRNPSYIEELARSLCEKSFNHGRPSPLRAPGSATDLPPPFQDGGGTLSCSQMFFRHLNDGRDSDVRDLTSSGLTDLQGKVSIKAVDEAQEITLGNSNPVPLHANFRVGDAPPWIGHPDSSHLSRNSVSVVATAGEPAPVVAVDRLRAHQTGLLHQDDPLLDYQDSSELDTRGIGEILIQTPIVELQGSGYDNRSPQVERRLFRTESCAADNEGNNGVFYFMAGVLGAPVGGGGTEANGKLHCESFSLQCSQADECPPGTQYGPWLGWEVGTIQAHLCQNTRQECRNDGSNPQMCDESGTMRAAYRLFPECIALNDPNCIRTVSCPDSLDSNGHCPAASCSTIAPL